MPAKRSLYDVLGVRQDASQEEIRRAYKRKAMELHPDRRGGDSAGFSDVANAYEVLSNPLKRKHYDVFGDASPDEITSVVLITCTGTCCCTVFFFFLGILRYLDWLRTPWAMVFTPVWFLDILLLPVLLTGMTSHWSDILISINIACLIAFTVLLYLQVEGTISCWLGVLSPLMISDFLMATTGPEEFTYKDLTHYPTWLSAAKTVTTSQWYSILILAVFGMKLDGVIVSNWWWVLLVPYLRWSISLIPSPTSDNYLWDLFFCLAMYTLAGSLVSDVPWSISIPLFCVWYVTSCCVEAAADVRLPSTVSMPPKEHASYTVRTEVRHEVTVDID